MLRKPSLSLKKVVKSKRLMKAIKGHQRPQSKKVKKSHFINHHFLTYTQDAFPSSKKVVMPKSLKKVIKGQKLKNASFYQLHIIGTSMSENDSF